MPRHTPEERKKRKTEFEKQVEAGQRQSVPPTPDVEPKINGGGREVAFVEKGGKQFVKCSLIHYLLIDSVNLLEFQIQSLNIIDSIQHLVIH